MRGLPRTITAMLGAPYFLFLLYRMSNLVSLSKLSIRLLKRIPIPIRSM
ncbi:MAG: hypothetical protein ABI700_11615 [Chloroflexota bacterium]